MSHSLINLKIDGRDVQIAAGATILEAAEKAGVKIPTLCYLQKVSPTGACRICVVEVAGADKPMTACNTVAVAGMIVTTQSEKLAAIRRQVVELLLVNHPLDCPVCDAGGECDLQEVCYGLDVTRQPFAAEDVSHAVINDWPLIKQIPSRCILCEKCVKVCHEVVGASAIVVREAGEKAFIDTRDGKPLSCEFCGNCVEACPTGTLLSKPFLFKARPWELTCVPSVCATCGSQCEIDINVKQDRIYRVTSADGSTVNDGNLCIGGYFGYGYLQAPQRLARPALKGKAEAGWSEALDAVVDKIRQVREAAGADAIAALGSPRLTNEENYLFQKLFRVAVGTNNIDSEARFGALRAAGTLKSALGLTGASQRLDRIGRAEAVLVFGADATAEAPAIDWQIEQACRKRDAKLVVANMRRVKLSRYAESFLQYRPGSEAQLAQALAAVILKRNLADEAFLTRFVGNLDELRADLQKVDLQAAAAATGLAAEKIEEAALHLGQAASVAIVFGSDLSKGEQAEAAVAALANLAMVCGALHGEVGGLFPVDEKGNMQGLLDMGVCPEFLPGFQPFEQARGKFEAAWQAKLPAGGRDARAILEGIEKGEIRLLFLAGTNPLVSFPDSGRWRRALAKVECLVVQDILDSELTRMAHVVLAGAGYAEKEGTITSLDNRNGRLQRAVAPPGEARADWEILADLFERLQPNAGRPQRAEVLAELKDLTELYTEVCSSQGGVPACQKAAFRPANKSMTYAAAAAAPTASGLELLTGKILFHFGTSTTFAASPLEVAPAGFIEMHPDDAAACGAKDGGTVQVKSALGTIRGTVRVSDQLQPGLIFAPYHFADLNVQQLIPAGCNRVAVQVSP